MRINPSQKLVRHCRLSVTLVAVRHNPWLRAYYQRLRKRGKLPKVAPMAAMRKLLVAIYTVAKHRRPFVPLVPVTTA